MQVSKLVYRIKIENPIIDFGEVKQEDYDRAKKLFEGIDFLELKPASELVGKSTYQINGCFVNDVSIVDDEKLLKLTVENVKFSVVESINLNVDVTQQIVEMAEKPIKITQDSGDNYFNSKCEVHMPGMALSMYNEVRLLEDCCTDALQGHLIDGWRIIAACPQPDQRRPDYILGRFNPTTANN